MLLRLLLPLLLHLLRMLLRLLLPVLLRLRRMLLSLLRLLLQASGDLRS